MKIDEYVYVFPVSEKNFSVLYFSDEDPIGVYAIVDVENESVSKYFFSYEKVCGNSVKISFYRDILEKNFTLSYSLSESDDGRSDVILNISKPKPFGPAQWLGFSLENLK